MTANPFRTILDIIRGTAWIPESQEQSDAQLLDRFVGGDGVALETLVRRHAAMVWGVCRRSLTHHEDAEDAFQATFLVLLRKAASLRSRELLANWLYGVAYKTAFKARQTAAKRCAREKQVVTMPEPPAETSDDTLTELLTHLDRELNGLPEKYRTAIVLCELQGRTLRDAAQQLRVAEGTVGSRLARGRAMLAQRMSRHGAGFSAGTVAALCSQHAASGALPTALLTRTIEAVHLMAAGQPVMAGLLSAEASTLSDAAVHAVAATKWKAASVVLLLAALAMGGGAVAYHSLPDQPSKPEQPPEPKGKNPPMDPIAERYGTAAGATSFAKTFFYEHNNLGVELNDDDDLVTLAWPSRDFKATCDPKTHQWTVTGAYRCDFIRGLKVLVVDGRLRIARLNPHIPFVPDAGDKECRSYEKDWKLVLSYNPLARAYGVQKAEGFDSLNHGGGEGWRPADMDDLGKWLQGRYTKLRPSATPVTALRLALDGPEWTKLRLEPKYAYGSKNMAVEPFPVGESHSPVSCARVRVWIDHPVAGAQANPWILPLNGLAPGAQAKPWRLEFGAPFLHSLKVGEYGGAYSGRCSGPSILVARWMPEGALPVHVGKSPAHWLANNPGEFVVREIELKDQKIVRLAIDFIIDTRALPSSVGDRRRIVRGSLRYNSQFALSIPELKPDAAE